MAWEFVGRSAVPEQFPDGFTGQQTPSKKQRFILTGMAQFRYKSPQDSVGNFFWVG
jgi:hypothetical protein